MFEFANFNFKIISREKLTLPPYKGSTFRGGFGHAFKRIVCVYGGKDCSGCPLREKCLYWYIFETPPPPDSQIMRKYPRAPHPFILTPPLENKTHYLPNETLDFHLTIVGKAIDYLPYFIYTFAELGKRGIGKGRGKFILQKVTSCSESGEVLVYDGEDMLIRNNYQKKAFDLMNWKEITSRITLNFLTPTRIKNKGTLTDMVDFSIILRNLLRRISLLSYFHCGERLLLDYKGLIEKSRRVKTEISDIHWVDWERYSARQNSRIKMGGFLGKASFRGNITPFMSFLRLGEYIHLGKGTAFGLGKYEIEETE